MSTRQEKVQELLKKEICYILQREFRDPRLGFITITEVEVTRDLQHAKVFVSVLGDDEVRRENLAVLKKAQNFFRQMLGKRVSMRTVPEIDFKLDTTADKSIRIMELLEEIKHDDEDTTA